MWSIEKRAYGCRLEFGNGKGGYCAFAPDQFGRVASFSYTKLVAPVGFVEIRAALDVARTRIKPVAGRYGYRNSALRLKFCEAVRDALNAASPPAPGSPRRRRP